MIFQPVLNVFLLALLFTPIAVLAVLALVKAPTTGSGTRAGARAS